MFIIRLYKLFLVLIVICKENFLLLDIRKFNLFYIFSYVIIFDDNVLNVKIIYYYIFFYEIGFKI